MNNEDKELIDALKKERADILSLPRLPAESSRRVLEIDDLIDDIERNYDTMRIHELIVDRNTSTDIPSNELEDDYGDYEYGEISTSFKDPNLDY